MRPVNIRLSPELVTSIQAKPNSAERPPPLNKTVTGRVVYCPVDRHCGQAWQSSILAIRNVALDIVPETERLIHKVYCA
jgi:hypothetical protein